MYFTPWAADEVHSLRRACAFLEALRFRAHFLRRGLWCKHASYFNLRLLSDSVRKAKIRKGSGGTFDLNATESKKIKGELCSQVAKPQRFASFIPLSISLSPSASSTFSFSLSLFFSPAAAPMAGLPPGSHYNMRVSGWSGLSSTALIVFYWCSPCKAQGRRERERKRERQRAVCLIKPLSRPLYVPLSTSWTLPPANPNHLLCSTSNGTQLDSPITFFLCIHFALPILPPSLLFLFLSGMLPCGCCVCFSLMLSALFVFFSPLSARGQMYGWMSADWPDLVLWCGVSQDVRGCREDNAHLHTPHGPRALPSTVCVCVFTHQSVSAPHKHTCSLLFSSKHPPPPCGQ